MSISVTTRRMSAPVLTSRRSPQGACLLLLVCTFACLLIGCSGSGDRMRQQLQQLQARNQSDSLLTDDSLATALCTWFDSHGTPNERMLAHYLMGRTWADKGEAPQALEEYHAAAECADTTAADCDYNILTRIHAQSANLFYEQQMPNEMLEELGLMQKSGLRAKDSLSWISAEEWKYVAYKLLGNADSAFASIKRAFILYNQSGKDYLAANCMPIIVNMLLDKREYDQALFYLNSCEQNSSLYKFGQATNGHEFYYHVKGNFYMAIGKLDSAEYYYRKELNTAKRLNDIEAASKGLFDYYSFLGYPDSASKYANLCYQTSEERFQESNAEQLSHMQSLYNYSRSQKIAHEKSEEALRQRYLLLSSLALFSILVILSVIAFRRYKRRKREELLNVMQSYQQKIEQQEQAKRDLLQLKEQETEALIAQKEQEIALRQGQIEQYHEIINQEIPLDIIFMETEEYNRFRYLCSHPREKVTKKDWKALQKMMDRCLPAFYMKMNQRRHLKESDYQICMLLRLHFAYSEIYMLTHTTPQYVYSRRLQLLKTVFDMNGKAEEFDKMLWHIK